MLGAAAGVIGFGQLFDRYGSYDMAFAIAVLLLVPAVISYLVLPNHKKGVI